jgi:hypothetical protein
MRVPHGEGVASHTGPESCGDDRKVVVEALTGERAGWAIEPRKPYCPGRRRTDVMRKATPGGPPRRGPSGSRGVEGPMHAPKHLTGEAEPPARREALRDGSREIPRPARMVIRARAVNLRRERRR